MRKLYYVGTNANGNQVRTPNFNEKVEYEKNGYVFNTQLVELAEELTKEEKEYRKRRIEKLNALRN